jgi:2-oxoglutarate ferredoxin oxidoreductase subunit gamma
MSAEAASKYGKKIRPDAIVIIDSTNIPADLAIGGKVYRLPITETAIRVGTKVVANTVALGVMNSLTGVVSRESLARAISARVPAKFRELNERALAAGEELAASHRAGRPQPAGVAG